MTLWILDTHHISLFQTGHPLVEIFSIGGLCSAVTHPTVNLLP